MYKQSNPSTKYKLKVDRICWHRDVALCSTSGDQEKPVHNSIERQPKAIKMQQDIKILGFPAYSTGQSHYIADSKIAKIYPQNGVNKFEIAHSIRSGNSGGPIIDNESKVVGVVLEGATKDSGNNGCLEIEEIDKLFTSDDYIIK